MIFKHIVEYYNNLNNLRTHVEKLALNLKDRAPIRTLSDLGGGLLELPPSISETIIDRDI